ncbi:MAG TPA: hypothetical protein VLF95_00885 [Vicinamibacteria bacterium]|nr:hypothetical protein [Vicinamibacteria bacterium]
MKDPIETVAELAHSVAIARFRKLKVEGEEHPDRSWQRVTCHLDREDVPWAAVPLIYALSGMSFGDARPRGASEMDYVEDDEWTLADLVTRLHLERGELVFDADYVRGRMMKTRIVIGSNGRFTIETRNRHEMALRWLDRLPHMYSVTRAGLRCPVSL